MRALQVNCSLSATALLAALSSLPAFAADKLDMAVLSAHAEAVTGGDTRLLVSADGRPVKATISVNGIVQGDLPQDADGSVVVKGLKLGVNEVQASAKGFTPITLQVVNHPRSGPVFSGPQLNPWACIDANPAADSPAPTPSDQAATCDRPSTFSLYYRTTKTDCSPKLDAPDACFRPYDPARRPADLAQTVTDGGIKTDYIVRVERGSLNRGLYDLAVLYRPAGRDASSNVTKRLGAWNRKLLWLFGGSSGNLRKQMAPATSWVYEDALRRGFMVGVSNFTDGSLNNNRILAAETLMMAREHVSDSYGQVRYLIGQGCSAGSMQQNVIASGYPGLLDGVLIACTFPDSETITVEIADAALLRRYFDGEAFQSFTRDKTPDEIERLKGAIAGQLDGGSVRAYTRFTSTYNPGARSDAPFDNACGLPNAWVFDPIKNPRGPRCTTPDFLVNLYGRSSDGSGRIVRDNVGVQYGLTAYRSGVIGAEQFVTLNEQIGGLDKSGAFSKQRMEGDPLAISASYRSGMTSDASKLAQVPIIDLRGSENSGVHPAWASFALRARLQAANGHLDNFAMWRTALPASGSPWANPEWQETGLPAESLDMMDAWLTAIEADKGGDSRETKVRRHRPTGLRSFCLIGKDYANRIYDEARCDADPELRYFGSIRQSAGQSAEANVLKCRLRPLARGDYSNDMTDTLFTRLSTVFPDGTCDWTSSGIGQQPAVPWLSYADGPQGTALTDLKR